MRKEFVCDQWDSGGLTIPQAPEPIYSHQSFVNCAVKNLRDDVECDTGVTDHCAESEHHAMSITRTILENVGMPGDSYSALGGDAASEEPIFAADELRGWHSAALYTLCNRCKEYGVMRSDILIVINNEIILLCMTHSLKTPLSRQ